MKLTFDYVFVVPLQILNRKVNSELYAAHVNHEHHLLPLFATAIAMVKSILILQTSQLHFCTGGLWQRTIDRQTKYLF
jgi:hypothetical protein